MIDLTNLDMIVDLTTFGIKIIVYIVIGVSIFFVMFRLAQRIKERILY